VLGVRGTRFAPDRVNYLVNRTALCSATRSVLG
jgi:hypothetical protein